MGIEFGRVRLVAVVAAMVVISLLMASGASAATYGPPKVIAGGFSFPEGVAVDSAGNVFVANNLAGEVVKIAPGGAKTTVASSLPSQMEGLGIDAAGDLFLADGNQVIEIPSGGGAPTSIGSGLGSPAGVAADAAGDAFVASPGGGIIEIPAGGAPKTILSGVIDPWGIAVDSAGNVFFQELFGNVEKISGGSVSTVASGLVGSGGLAVDSADDLFFNEGIEGRIIEIAPGGAKTAIAENLTEPGWVAVDSAGNVFVTEERAGEVLELPVLDATATETTCGPTAAPGTAQTCTAKVADTESASHTPTGTVTFSASGAGSFGGGATCILAAGSCSVHYTPSASGPQTVTAEYQGDEGHTGSNGETTLSTLAAVSPPTVTITAPEEGATYTKGQVVHASFSCKEGAGGPGLKAGSAGCSGSVASGAAINTSTLGPQAFSVTATSRDGQSTTETVDYTVVAAGNGADLSAAISGPTHAADGTSFTETITVANAGPAAATEVITGLVVPAGLTVTNAGGGSRFGPALYWTAHSIAAKAKVTYTVTFKVSNGARGNVGIVVATASTQIKDPNYANNAAAMSVALGSNTAGGHFSGGWQFGHLTLNCLEHHRYGY